MDWAALIAGLALVATTALGWAMFKANRKLVKEQANQAGADTDATKVNTIIDLQERMDLLWKERNDALSELSEVKRRVTLLEAEVYRLGGDPTLINGGRKRTQK